MDEDEILNKIDDYLLGHLNDSDLQSFEQELQRNQDLAAQLKLRRELIGGVETFGRQTLKRQLQEIHREVIPQPIVKALPRQRKLWPYLAAAASVLLLIIAFWTLNTNATTLHSSELYASHFEPYDISSMQRNATDEEVIKLKQLYKKGKYADALPLLETRLEALNPQPSYLLLAKGIALLETDQPEKALLEFQKIMSNQDFNFEDEARWYTAMTYLKMNNTTAARNSLQALADNAEADHHQAAKSLLEQLKNK